MLSCMGLKDNTDGSYMRLCLELARLCKVKHNDILSGYIRQLNIYQLKTDIKLQSSKPKKVLPFTLEAVQDSILPCSSLVVGTI